jgi:hypothetical protein
MSDLSIPISLPLDESGFLRRECPNCERQFKWWPTPDEDAVEEVREEVEAYFCPYCHEPAPPSSWWTKEQVEYMQQLAAAEALGPQLQRMKNSLESGNRRSKWISIEMSVPDLSRPEPLVELDDMVRVDMPCHPEEPLKVDEAWDGEAACLVCGIRYPVELVQALPETGSGETE